MRISLKWIKELLPDLRASATSLEKRLAAAGIEVERVEHQKNAFRGIVVGEVRSVVQHPEADKLRLTTVFDGTSEHPVVCGAPNVEAGQRVAFAPVGVRLPTGLFLEPRTIRGVESRGMICSAAELGLPGTSEGILVLKPRSKPGRALSELLDLDDVFFDLALTPNRPDLLSHLGIARELAALHRLSAPRPTFRVREDQKRASECAKVDIEDLRRCPKYVARVVLGVRVGPSPAWVERRLRGLGLRSISNVVDATNLVLLELGHPLHAFDLEKLRGARVVVRTAVDGESMTTLDGVERTLSVDDLVIADDSAPVALAGVMGGRDSEVSEGTTDILLESALFDPASIRRTAKRHGLHTEASHRFERGADMKMVEHAVDRCAALIVELASGRIQKDRLLAGRQDAPVRTVPLRPERASLVLGRTVTRQEARSVLTALGLRPTKLPVEGRDRAVGKTKRSDPKSATRPKDTMYFEIPSHRVDLVREEDLIEEVARVSGYETIPTIVPSVSSPLARGIVRPPPESRIRDTLVAHGFFETISLAFGSRRHVEWMGIDPGAAVEVANPLGEESQILRLSLLPSLLAAVRLNQDNLPSIFDVRMFEVGRTFAWSSLRGGEPADDSSNSSKRPRGSIAAELPVESPRVGIVMRGRRLPPGWGVPADPIDAFDLKAVVERTLGAFGVEGVSYQPDRSSWLHPRSATCIECRGVLLGSFGEVHPDVLARFAIEGSPVFAADLDLRALDEASAGFPSFVPLPKHPPAQRDLSFFVGRDVTAAAVLAAVRGAGAEVLETVELFDVYEGKGVPEGEKSLAIALVFRAPDRTLTDREVDEAQGLIVAALAGLGAHIRANPS